MRRLLPLFLALAAPAGLAALDYADALHLTERTGFGAPPEAVYRLAGLDRTQAVDLILDHLTPEPAVPPPAWSQPPYEKPPTGDKAHPVDPEARKAYDQHKEARKAELRAWFIDDAVKAPWPLNQKLDLFWHNHFTSSLEKLDNAELLLQQDLLFRRLGIGSFADLLRAVSEDPAMVIYLDGDSNQKGKPNENYAREVLELFTLGEGHYTEADIKEAARAFTGWTVDRVAGRATLNPKRHDDGIKAFLGTVDYLDQDRVLTILLDQDRTAVFLTEKFWRAFVSPDPDPAKVVRFADAFRASGYQIKVLLRLLLLDDAFWAPQNRDSLVRSPLELMAGQIRTWGLTGYDPKRMTWQLARLGQDLFNPLSVKGWPEGLDWVDSATLLERRRDLADLANLFRKQWQSPETNLK